MSEPLDLEAIKTRAEFATAGPWTAEVRKGDLTKAMVYRRFEFFGTQTEIVTLDIEADDAEFIAHARTDVPALVAEVERLRTNNAELVALTQPILDRTEGYLGTHSSRCFEYHVACLAHLVRERLT